MGLLDEVNEAMGSAAPGGSLSKPLMIALGALLVGKMMSGGSAQAATPATRRARFRGWRPSRGVGGLLDKLKDAGHGDKVNSWVGPAAGAKKPIQPGELGEALGQQTVSTVGATSQHERAATAVNAGAEPSADHWQAHSQFQWRYSRVCNRLLLLLLRNRRRHR